MKSADMLDVVGIGFGPANIALAIAAEELMPRMKITYLEKNATAGWQEEMLLPESDIQNHPLRDLVTPRNPRSRYTFTNFLYESGRLFEHLNLPLAHPLRIEYRQYVMWVAQHFADRVQYSSAVHKIEPVIEQGKVKSYQIIYGDEHLLQGRSVVLASGRTPNIPKEFSGVKDPRIAHLMQFLGAFEKARARNAAPRIAVVGGSQTAVELLLHLSNHPGAGEVTGISRNFGFRLKDTSPFSDEVYFPEFVDTFFHATAAQKKRLRDELVFTNYSASDRDVLDSLYVQMYRNKISGKGGLTLKRLSSIVHVHADDDAIHLTLNHNIDGSMETLPFDLVILATGFKDLGAGKNQEPFPSLLQGVAEHLDLDDGVLIELRINNRYMLK
jgi:L-ornithine N5-monooxygenase